MWAFSIGCDWNQCRFPCTFLTFGCLSFPKANNVQNLCLLAIPIQEGHSGECQYNLVVSFMDVLAPDWKYSLIGIATDGA